MAADYAKIYRTILRRQAASAIEPSPIAGLSVASGGNFPDVAQLARRRGVRAQALPSGATANRTTEIDPY